MIQPQGVVYTIPVKKIFGYGLLLFCLSFAGGFFSTVAWISYRPEFLIQATSQTGPQLPTHYMQRAVASATNAEGADTQVPPTAEPELLLPFIEVVSSCDAYFKGTCVKMRSGPGEDYPVVLRLRNNIVLKVASSTIQGETTWYKIGFSSGVRYPGRVRSAWWVSGDDVELIQDVGLQEVRVKPLASSTKQIIINLTNKKLYAYDGDVLFLEKSISPGLSGTPTPAGTFWIFKKVPDSYMQGPLPGISGQYFDLPGVPWSLYFTQQGAAIHGAYWHDKFGRRWSHGCVNLPGDEAKKLYAWAELGTPVIVRY